MEASARVLIMHTAASRQTQLLTTMITLRITLSKKAKVTPVTSTMTDIGKYK
jgi:hypothetical protein